MKPTPIDSSGLPQIIDLAGEDSESGAADAQIFVYQEQLQSQGFSQDKEIDKAAFFVNFKKWELQRASAKNPQKADEKKIEVVVSAE